MPDPIALHVRALQTRYRADPSEIDTVNRAVLERIERYPDPAVWIHRVEANSIRARIADLRQIGPSPDCPLWGVPFAVKDNIDVAGIPTTAACPAFSHVPERSATVVEKLLDAGAILLGKTNMDQFATGLVGTRSPYGAVCNTFDPAYISGGSSSGSAVAVAARLVSFALGTDTAGSGRIPAAFNNITGYKPTGGLLSTLGVVPACRSLDCVSIFASECSDAQTIAQVARGYDMNDPYSKSFQTSFSIPDKFRFGIPHEVQLQFFGNDAFAALYRQAIGRLSSIGGVPVTIDYTPFSQAAALLYQGPWVAERYASFGKFVDEHPDDVLPVLRQILQSAARFSATDVFTAQHGLAQLSQQARLQWQNMDVLLLPTAGTIYRRSEVDAEPIALNANLGYYTNFVNLMDLCAVAVPAGLTSAHLPFGITLIAPRSSDDSLLQLGQRYEAFTQISPGSPTQIESQR